MVLRALDAFSSVASIDHVQDYIFLYIRNMPKICMCVFGGGGVFFSFFPMLSFVFFSLLATRKQLLNSHAIPFSRISGIITLQSP